MTEALALAAGEPKGRISEQASIRIDLEALRAIHTLMIEEDTGATMVADGAMVLQSVQGKAMRGATTGHARQGGSIIVILQGRVVFHAHECGQGRVGIRQNPKGRSEL